MATAKCEQRSELPRYSEFSGLLGAQCGDWCTEPSTRPLPLHVAYNIIDYPVIITRGFEPKFVENEIITAVKTGSNGLL